MLNWAKSRRTLWIRTLFTSMSCLWMASCAPTYPKCDSDSHCADKGEVCVEGSCQQCRDDSACADGQMCQGGRCETKADCAGDTDCSGNQVCQLGRCQTECQAASDCATGLKCQNNRCVDSQSCDSNRDCGSGGQCIAGRCADSINASRDLPCGYPTVHFPFNEATLSRDVKSGLSEVAECLKSRKGTLVVEGHCDERGTQEYNLALGDRRARAVRDYLVRLGVSRRSISVVSKGENEPVNSGQNEDAWSENRRAEFIER